VEDSQNSRNWKTGIRSGIFCISFVKNISDRAISTTILQSCIFLFLFHFTIHRFFGFIKRRQKIILFALITSFNYKNINKNDFPANWVRFFLLRFLSFLFSLRSSWENCVMETPGTFDKIWGDSDLLVLKTCFQKSEGKWQWWQPRRRSTQLPSNYR
jgi:hypothetical protein